MIGSMAKASPSPPNASHLDFLCAVFRDASQPMSRRMRAAAQVAPFVHPKLSAMAVVDSADFASRLDAAIARTNRMKQIETEWHSQYP